MYPACLDALLGSIERAEVTSQMDTLEFLAQVSASIKSRGKFVSRKDAAKLGVKSTGEDAAEAIYFDGQSDFSDEDTALASEALDWIRNTDHGDNKFLNSLAQKVALDTIVFNNADMASWVIPAYQQRTNGAATNLSDYSGNTVFYGQPGDEAVFQGDIVHVITTKGGAFGPAQYVGIADNKNHFFLWKTSGGRANGLKPGMTVRVVAKVKDHTSYKGVNQTRITHPKFL